ncbi:MAG: malate dehydrogenase, partial [Verrucomicrobia bacterium]
MYVKENGKSQGLPISDFSRSKIDASVAELNEVKSLVSE